MINGANQIQIQDVKGLIDVVIFLAQQAGPFLFGLKITCKTSLFNHKPPDMTENLSIGRKVWSWSTKVKPSQKL